MNSRLSVSRTRQSTPAARRMLPTVSPAGPAPTTTTGHCCGARESGWGELCVIASLWRHGTLVAPCRHGPGERSAEPGYLDRRAAVHHHVQTRRTSPLVGRLVDDAELEPHRLRALGHRLV